MTVERVKDYWGQNLPIRKGSGNFDRITYRYYRDSTVMFEAFKAGEYDWRQENIARQWATAMIFRQLRMGVLLKSASSMKFPWGAGLRLQYPTPGFPRHPSAASLNVSV